MVLDSKKWDSGRWDGWEIILGFIPLFFATSGRTKRREHYFCLFVVFSIFGRSRKKTKTKSKSMFSALLQEIDSGTILSGTASKSECHNIGSSHHKL